MTAKFKNPDALDLSDPTLTPESWVRDFCSLHGIEYNYKTNSFHEGDEVIDISLLLSRMRLEAHNLKQSHLKGLLPDAVAVFRKEQERKFLSDLRKRLKFQPSDRDYVKEWTEAVTGKLDELDVAIVRHFVWQVRRKLHDMTVAHHNFIILYGKSGSGKSIAIHSLLKPLEDVSTSRDMSIFSDSFGRSAFCRNYIMLMDELGKSHKTDMEMLKNVVSSPRLEWRGINSESSRSGPQRCTFIGASNHPVRERLHDTTSARRFWQLNCVSRLDWNKINSIDYLALWKSINENDPCPLLPLLERIQEIQNREIRAKDIVEQWLEEVCEPARFDDKRPTTEILYEFFRK